MINLQFWTFMAYGRFVLIYFLPVWFSVLTRIFKLSHRAPSPEKY